MTRWIVKTSKGKKRLGSFYGTKREAEKWAKRLWKIPFQLVSPSGRKYIINRK